MQSSQKFLLHQFCNIFLQWFWDNFLSSQVFCRHAYTHHMNTLNVKIPCFSTMSDARCWKLFCAFLSFEFESCAQGLCTRMLRYFGQETVIICYKQNKFTYLLCKEMFTSASAKKHPNTGIRKLYFKQKVKRRLVLKSTSNKYY